MSCPEKDMPAPAMPLYVRDWLAGRAIRVMTPEQRGAFIQLLCDAWADPTAPCSLPADDADLAALSGLGPERWAAVGARVRAEFRPPEEMRALGIEVPDDGRLRNAKQWAVYQEQLQHREQKSRAGRLGMEARWGKRREEREAEPEPAPHRPSTYPPEFEATWAIYPRRAGGNPKKAAYKAWLARVRAGTDPAELHAATENYAAHIRTAGREHTEYVLHGATFFGPNERWREFAEVPAAPVIATPETRAQQAYQNAIDALEGDDACPL